MGKFSYCCKKSPRYSLASYLIDEEVEMEERVSKGYEQLSRKLLMVSPEITDSVRFLGLFQGFGGLSIGIGLVYLGRVFKKFLPPVNEVVDEATRAVDELEKIRKLFDVRSQDALNLAERYYDQFESIAQNIRKIADDISEFLDNFDDIFQKNLALYEVKKQLSQIASSQQIIWDLVQDVADKRISIDKAVKILEKNNATIQESINLILQMDQALGIFWAAAAFGDWVSNFLLIENFYARSYLQDGRESYVPRTLETRAFYKSYVGKLEYLVGRIQSVLEQCQLSPFYMKEGEIYYCNHLTKIGADGKPITVSKEPAFSLEKNRHDSESSFLYQFVASYGDGKARLKLRILVFRNPAEVAAYSPSKDEADAKYELHELFLPDYKQYNADRVSRILAKTGLTFSDLSVQHIAVAALGFANANMKYVQANKLVNDIDSLLDSANLLQSALDEDSGFSVSELPVIRKEVESFEEKLAEIRDEGAEPAVAGLAPR